MMIKHQLQSEGTRARKAEALRCECGKNHQLIALSMVEIGTKEINREVIKTPINSIHNVAIECLSNKPN
jgi:hypothetical protein